MHNTTLRLLAVLTLMVAGSSLLFAQDTGFDTSRMDKTIDACNDFFDYANGTWLKNTEIPSTETRWGTFNILADNNNAILKKILEDAAKTKAAAGSDTQLIGDFYSSCMDEAAINKAGSTPLKAYLKQIASIKTSVDLQKQIAAFHSASIPAFFGFGGGPDLKNSSMVIMSAGQGGLSLPNRDYYVKDDGNFPETRQKFTEYTERLFKLLGDSPEQAAANAKTVLAIQKQLAGASMGSVELRNPDNRYNKISLKAAQEITPNFSWTTYLANRGIKPEGELNLAQPQFFKALNGMLASVSINDLKTYLRFMLVNNSADSLATPFADAKFDFFSKFLGGQKEQQPRWKTCVQNANAVVGEALGMAFVKETFDQTAKAKMDQLITNLFVSMKGRINNLDWMSAPTKVQAQAKLSTIKRKIGYPDVLRGYKGLSLSRKSYFDNLVNASRFQVARNAADIGKPVDRTRWGFTPPTVNASYSPINNEITFPAGILQPPFFNSKADDAINYGAIGGVIGHEITHGFDDSGSKFDADGNLKMWWTSEDRTKFEEKTACLIDQFNKIEVQPGLFIDGKLTLGENIGDFAGLTVAYDAFKKSQEGKPRQANIDGFTPEQRFFLGWAQVWAGKYSDAAERLLVKTNPHSHPRWRVNAPLANMPQFANAFGCKQGQRMVRQNACTLW